MPVNKLFSLYSHIFDLIYKHIVPTGLNRMLMTFCYKHIVPTGLMYVSNISEITKTPSVDVKQIITISYLAQLVRKTENYSKTYN